MQPRDLRESAKEFIINPERQDDLSESPQQLQAQEQAWQVKLEKMREHRKSAKAPKPMQQVFAFHDQLAGEADKNTQDPRLLNLHDDQQMNHSVQIIMSPGHPITVGRPDAEPEQDIKFQGLGVSRKHMLFFLRSLGVGPGLPIL